MHEQFPKSNGPLETYAQTMHQEYTRIITWHLRRTQENETLSSRLKERRTAFGCLQEVDPDTGKRLSGAFGSTAYLRAAQIELLM